MHRLGRNVAEEVIEPMPVLSVLGADSGRSRRGGAKDPNCHCFTMRLSLFYQSTRGGCVGVYLIFFTKSE